DGAAPRRGRAHRRRAARHPGSVRGTAHNGSARWAPAPGHAPVCRDVAHPSASGKSRHPSRAPARGGGDALRAFVAEVAAERRASALLAGWQRFWFRPVSAGPLGFCRVLFFAYMLVHLAPRADSTDWSQIDPAFWSPIHLFAALRLSAAPASILRALDLIWLL